MEWLQLLLESGRCMDEAPDGPTALRRLLALLVPRVADGAVVEWLTAEDAAPRRLVRHADPEREAAALALADVPGEAPEGLLHAPGAGSWQRVPLEARGRELGFLLLAHTGSGRPLGAQAQALLTELGRRAALVLEAQRLEAEARRGREEVAREQVERARARQELEQFVSVAGHDLKAPLRGLASLSQWLEEDLARGDTREVSQHLQLLRSRVRRMDVLVEGLLQYSRADRKREAPEPVDVGALLAQVVTELGPSGGARVEVATGLPVLVVEQAPLRQVFLHLVANALRHAGRPDVTVKVGGHAADGGWHFSVRDDGVGIAPEFHERIWGLLLTLQSRDVVEGAGVGLSVVRKLVEARGGRAWVESSPGAGATFHFTWPVAGGSESHA